VLLADELAHYLWHQGHAAFALNGLSGDSDLHGCRRLVDLLNSQRREHHRGGDGGIGGERSGRRHDDRETVAAA
jgi:hypothetical protein